MGIIFNNNNLKDSDIMNKLSEEKSPYLLQHKNNPVDWHPWGEEALTKARTENKPLFISIGYSTCHWCHVMNRESFQDAEVAEILNKNFLPIKVDREERPDIDKVYMTFSEAMTGSGGWPLNILATPEGKPFFLGTYFPKTTKNRMTGIIDLLEKINRLWRYDRDKVLEESQYILNEVKKRYLVNEKGNIKNKVESKAKDGLKRIFDNKNGGFGSYPKFPMPQYIWFLLEYSSKNNDKEALEIAEITLEKMYKGGIFDHIGYGFYRYSVDEKWLIPHFEKMLYDNALLGIVYTKTYEITKKTLYKEVAEKIYEFVLRYMLSSEGGFYSALDAESEGKEGKFYIFDYNEVFNVLGKELGELYSKYYGITEEGNFEGANNPNLILYDLSEISESDKLSLDKANKILFEYREKRVKPHRDEKILTSWNGLMIASLAYASRIFNNKNYSEIAKKSADFIIKNSMDKDGHLLSTHINGESYNTGYLEDYSFFIYGLLQLYETLKENKYLDLGIKLSEDMIELFGDDREGGLFFYSNISEQLIMRPKDIYDGAIPSGNSLAIMSLFKIYKLTKEEEYEKVAKEILYAFGEDINNNPLAHLYSLIALGKK
ncbi:thioredoxin domain-containing protein [Tissierella praeacuta]|uniref:thioredoxin domain-containing protein n=2 Tax=Tissierella praeacuta TaxID=43131 RepID=UPI0028ADB77E|nr:thioredoxin domain-containing protein [Tissierella praeacuta]